MENHFTFPLSARVLAPAGGFTSPFAIFNAERAITQHIHSRSSDDLDNPYASFFQQISGVAALRTYSSGTAALYSIFECLRRGRGAKAVGLSSFTCPDIAVAAIRAGLNVVPLDVDPETLELRLKGEDDLVFDVLVLSNLYGLPDRLPVPSIRESCAVVDDACQSFLSFDSGERLGLRDDTIGVLSFGRGKALCGVGGGAVISKKPLECGIAATTVSKLRLRALSELIFGVACYVLENPYLYRVVASIPQLGLGQTDCDLDFAVKEVSEIQLLHAAAQFLHNESRRESMLSVAMKWQEALRDVGVIDVLRAREALLKPNDEVLPIRYPLVLPSAEVRDKAFVALSKAGLGASVSYAKTLFDFPELQSKIVGAKHCPGAEKLAKNLITLPVHRFVNDRVIDQTLEILRKLV